MERTDCGDALWVDCRLGELDSDRRRSLEREVVGREQEPLNCEVPVQSIVDKVVFVFDVVSICRIKINDRTDRIGSWVGFRCSGTAGRIGMDGFCCLGLLRHRDALFYRSMACLAKGLPGPAAACTRAIRAVYSREHFRVIMFGKIFKGLAVAAGVGLAIGVGFSKRRSEEKSRPEDSAGARRLRERFDGIEARIARVESQKSTDTAELNQRISTQAADLEGLRVQMAEYREKIATDIASISRRVEDVTKGLPSMLDAIVAPKVDDLRLRLRAEIQQSVSASLTTFERAIDDKVSDRIAALEKAMLDQSALVTALSQRAIESDLNLQRLISAIERLCDRPGSSPEVRAAAA